MLTRKKLTVGPFAALVVGLAIVWALTFAGRIIWFGGSGRSPR